TGAKRAAMLGISFKRNTDDLRESPYLLLARQLAKDGMQLKIHDPDVHPEKLLGVNRAYATEVLPDLPQLLTPDLDAALACAEVVILCKRIPDKETLARIAERFRFVFDLEYLARAMGVTVPAHRAVE